MGGVSGLATVLARLRVVRARSGPPLGRGTPEKSTHLLTNRELLGAQRASPGTKSKSRSARAWGLRPRPVAVGVRTPHLEAVSS